MNNDKMDLKRLIGPVLVWSVGLILIIIFAPTTVHVNGKVGLGLLALCVGTFWALYVLYAEYDKTGKPLPSFLNGLFPDYPVMEDFDKLTKRLSGFRKSYSDFLSSEFEQENSSLQNYASQLMWHSLALQKKRLMRNHLTLEMDSVRRAYSHKQSSSHKLSSVRQSKYFDGRYQVNDVYEEISALRRFKQDGKIIKRIRDSEVAHFTLLSANQVGPSSVVCPNCGAVTTRENLLDGCDYCGTRFLIEDMENRIDSFGLRRDFRTSASKKDAVRELMFPWTTLIVILPLLYFGLIGAFVYMPDMNIFLRLITGLFAAGLLGLLGWCLKSIFLTLITPLLLLIVSSSRALSRKMIYSRKQEEEQEQMMADYVRRADPLFSIQSFFGGLQNKLSAVHYAESSAEINAFSETDMSALIGKYQNVVDVDFRNMTMDSYGINGYFQIATVTAGLRLMEWKGHKIKERDENLKMTLIKYAVCKTQAVCGASILKCKGCGSSLSLMEGKTCKYCGRNLDLKLYDWVIANYDIV